MPKNMCSQCGSLYFSWSLRSNKEQKCMYCGTNLTVNDDSKPTLIIDYDDEVVFKEMLQILPNTKNVN
jgi:transcription initiation factor IIE alpha subunit